MEVCRVEPDEADEIAPDIDAWARAHGFEPSDEQIGGSTPLLRMGVSDVTATAYSGPVGEHSALLSEFSIGSPGLSDAFGGSSTSSTWFTLFLFAVDASRIRRLTIHPSHYDGRDWVARLLHQDRRVDGINPALDDRYRVIASTDASDDRLAAFLDDAFTGWLLAQTELAVDIEDHAEHGGYLMVARSGIGLSDADLDILLGQAEHVASHAREAL
jgi:hypothetical protein